MSGSKTIGGAQANTTDGVVMAHGEVIRYSTRYKYYGSELAEVLCCNKCVFNPDDLSTASSQHRRTKTKPEQDYDDSDNLERSKRRARKAVFDYAMCNSDLDTFVTFTLAPDRIDRYDYTAAIKRLNVWLRNRVQRKGLKYVFVCEQHKDGAYHFHGLANAAALKLVDSGHADKRGHTVYNVADWALGFTTAVKCYGKRAHVCKYITKYITKSDSKVGGRWYYSSNNLTEPVFVYGGAVDVDNFVGFDLYEKDLPNAGLSYKILTRRF